MSRVRDIIDVRRTPRMERMELIASVAERNGASVSEVLSRRRDRRIVKARHAAILAVRERFDGDSLPMIGRLFNRDHTSILHVVRKGAN